MQYELQIFKTDKREDLRTITINGDPWFVLADVCRLLELADKKGGYGHHAERLDDDEKRSVLRADLNGHPPAGEGGAIVGSSTLLAISESGLIAMMLSSSRPEARKLRKWITSEVIPAIRRTGAYSARPTPVPTEWQPFHDRIGTAWAAVPEGYFSIFKEMADLTGHLIVGGMKVDHQTIPDISLGMAWAKHWVEMGYDHEYGFRITYEHNYPPSFPQAKSNPQWPYCYPEDAISVFRRWVRNVYLKEGLPKYLKGQVSNAKIDAVKAAALMKAVQATLPAPGSPLPLPRR